MANQAALPGGAGGGELKKALAPDEPVLGWASGKVGGLLVATDRRVLIIKTGFVLTGQPFGHTTVSYPYQQITSVQMTSGLADGYVEISTGGVQAGRAGRTDQAKADNIVPFNAWSRGSFDSVAALIRQHLAGQGTTPAPTNAAPATTPQSIPEQIEALARLRDVGVLTPEEFDAKKAELLGRM